MSEELFVCIPQSAQLKDELSFEEVRVADYLKAYQTNGLPPPPCPEIPADPAERAALNLPPILIPFKAPREPLPDLHWWEPTKNDGEYLQSIVAASKYSGHSPEEMRCQAYANGKKDVPAEHSTHPSVLRAQLPTASLASPITPTKASFSGTPVPGENLQSLSALTDKTRHSFEEHRIAFIFAGRELNDTEIETMQAANPITAPRLSAASPLAGVSVGAPQISPAAAPSMWAAKPAAFRPF
ncbi:hypothetical protein CYLTODRAFT_488297 [Cylindrobasidium torrendii FP15055 ss-10]|uniref:Uncharacterized protein n=1 Tax=Cylindrobasidium torrendii FP15055 ss-10 TaxID=1314674 RepID=A0A0D7BJ65_9AGAR|nr:hypothetical protein CYLTODRAFT_488297 [Cylindrobasidium torrendii FP15055 ss-10]